MKKKKNNKNQENFSFNLVDLNKNEHKLYYEKQHLKHENEKKTFVEFIEIKSIFK